MEKRQSFLHFFAASHPIIDLDMKYIDAERLQKEVKRLERAAHKSALDCADSETRKFHEGKALAYQFAGILIDSLQQEQPDFPTTDEEMEMFLATHPKIEVPDKYKTPDWLWKKQEQPRLPGIEENGIPGKDFIPIGWVDACEKYGKWKIVKVEQPEADLEKEIHDYWLAVDWCHVMELRKFKVIARYFYGLGLNARKEK